MWDLDEHQFELLLDDDNSDGYPFGIGLDVEVDENGFDPGTMDWLTQDTTDPVSGVTRMGRDVPTPSAWAWTMHTNRDDVATSLSAFADLADGWLNFEGNATPGQLAVVRYRLGGRVRRVYGRPRRFGPAALDNKILFGIAPVLADFTRTDKLHYDDEESFASLNVNMSPTPTLAFPMTFPLQAVPVTTNQTYIPVGGDRPIYPRFRITGPCSAPKIITSDWTLSMPSLALGGAEYVDIDLRPWVTSIIRNGIDSVAGTLARSTYLSDCFLRPGQNPIIFQATGDYSSAAVTARWRNAWCSL